MNRPLTGGRSLGVRSWLMALVAVGILPLIVLSAMLLLGLTATNQRQTEQTLHEMVRLLGDEVDREIARVMTAAEVLAADPDLQQGDLAAFHTHAVTVRDLLDTNVVVRDLTGQQVVNTRLPWGAELPHGPVAEVDGRIRTSGRSQVSGLLTGRVTQQPLVIVATPVWVQGELKYILSLTLSLDRLQSLITPQRLPDGWAAGIVDRNGILLARTHQPERFIGQPLPEDLWSTIKEAPEGIHQSLDLEGRVRMQTYHRAEISGWLVGVLVPRSLIAGAGQRSLLLFAFGGLGMLLISLSLAALLGRRLAAPIRRLAGAAQEVGLGRRPDLPPPSRIAEVDSVRVALQEAADLIEARENALTQAKDEAVRANLAKTKFLAAGSHDLRQPLQALLLLHARARRAAADGPLAADLETMGAPLAALRTLLDSLLDMSKLDAGIIVPTRQDVPINGLLATLSAEFAPVAEAKGLRFRTLCGHALVRTDPVLLERILRNLIENAINHTRRGGVVVGCRRRGKVLRVQVVDTGIGIPAESHDEIFEEFLQLHNPERDRSKGLGLGLAIVRRLAAMLGHPVTVRSRPGRGSVFSVDLPLVAFGRPEREPPQPPVRHTDGTVLVIDDEAMVRVALQATLESWGYRVFAAEGVAEALEEVEAGARPVAILADYRLRAGSTGLDAVRAVQERLKTQIPAIIISGDTAPERLTEVRAAGFALMHKPVRPADLEATLADMVAAR